MREKRRKKSPIGFSKSRIRRRISRCQNLPRTPRYRIIQMTRKKCQIKKLRKRAQQKAAQKGGIEKRGIKIYDINEALERIHKLIEDAPTPYLRQSR